MKKCFVIVKKEFKEIFRDKSAIVILMLSILIFPVLNVGINYLSKTSNTEINICIQSDSCDINELMLEFISSNKQYNNVNIIESHTPKALLLDGKLDFFISYDGKEIKEPLNK